MVLLAIVVAISFVPVSKFDISNTPMGPFHKMVFELSIAALNSAIEFGPMSRPIHPSGIL
ncbi:uncharacterized protein METZ01_LOCUS434551 [marine metagenome]|uniref:Uncharacterized protein n=1 Tax=marine metagenome TaxID=408172 RepID=A0A382YEG8_9ZZZZ